MWISDSAIRRPVITVVVMVALVMFGLIALVTLKTDEYPDVAPPVVNVGVLYPGASPETVEKEVLDPIEEAISSITGVKRDHRQGVRRLRVLMIEFEFAKQLAEATQDIRDGISGIRTISLPRWRSRSSRKLNDTDRPIISLALSSAVLAPRELTRIADPGITRELRSIPGVAEVHVSASSRARAHGRARARRAAVGGHQRGAGGPGAAGAEPRRPGRAPERRPRRALDSPPGTAREPGRI